MVENNCPKSRGEQTEAQLLSELVRRGVVVLSPFGENHRYDYVIDIEGDFHRIQCKTGRYDDGRIIFSTKSTRPRANEVSYEDYMGSIDYFLIYCWELESAYMVPIDDASTSEMVLRVETPGNNQSKGINWADEYCLDAVVSTDLGT